MNWESACVLFSTRYALRNDEEVHRAGIKNLLHNLRKAINVTFIILLYQNTKYLVEISNEYVESANA